MIMRMWISLGFAAALLIAGAIVWHSQDQGGPRRPAHPGGSSDGDEPTGPGGDLPHPKAVPRKNPLDGKVVFHLLKLGDSRTGCRVEFRTPDNGLARTGLKEGDVIVEVEGRPMSTQMALALSSRLDQASLTGLDLTILRNGQSQRVTARIGQ